jgi:uncharacterized protein YndB with AHSA1/START domain
MTTTPQDVPATLVIERTFAHSPEKLWRALTESQLLAQWLMNNDFESTVGRKFQFRSNPVPGWDGLIHCEVLIVEPSKRLSYTWSSMGADFVVGFTLTPADGGTHLRMEQSGFRPEHQAAYKGATYGWQHFLANLEGLLERQEQASIGQTQVLSGGGE